MSSWVNHTFHLFSEGKLTFEVPKSIIVNGFVFSLLGASIRSSLHSWPRYLLALIALLLMLHRTALSGSPIDSFKKHFFLFFTFSFLSFQAMTICFFLDPLKEYCTICILLLNYVCA